MSLNKYKNKSLIDPFGREIDYIRVSVTDRCDFRCVYCMSEEMTFLPKKELLTLEELELVCKTFISLGVKKIRLTGGEPLVRKNIIQLINNLGLELKRGTLKELTITTNGSQLSKMAGPISIAGVKRINISIDTLDPEKFKMITRWGDLNKVLEGIDAAKKNSIRIKLNVVALKGINDKEIVDIIKWCADNDHDITIIEVMPMGDIGSENRIDQYLPLSELREDLSKIFTMSELDYKTPGPARYFKISETGQRIGFITPLTHNFCESCNRVRLTCTGKLYMCLGQDDNANLAYALRNGGEEKLRETIFEAISRKPKGHDFIISRNKKLTPVNRHMNVTGG